MTVSELIIKLMNEKPNAQVRMCMDWTKIENGPKGQWEDALGGIMVSKRTSLESGKTFETVILVNENFK